MAIDFPNSPSNGQEYTVGSTTWIYDGSKWNLKIASGTTNDTLPVGAIMWYASSTTPTGWLKCDGSSYATTTYPTLYAVIGYTFGGSGANFNVPNISSTTGTYYIRYTTAIGVTSTTALYTSPVGSMIDWPITSSYPTGWLRANGAAVSRSTYNDLFTLIGTTYGSGDGSTTFNIPNVAQAGAGSPVTIIKATLSGVVEPSTVSHASTHVRLGADVIDGDRVQVDYVPTNYSRDSSDSNAGANTDVTAHLKGIDNIVGRTNRNWIINGGFDVWQRSTDTTSNTVSGTYYAAADRWQTWLGSATNIRYQRTTGTNNTYAYRIQRQSGSSVATNTQISQGLEQANAVKLAGKTVTLSFYAKAGANFSSASLSARIYVGTTGDVNLINTGATLQASTAPVLTTTSTRYTLTTTVPSNSLYVGLNFIVNWTGTAGADDWFELENVQLEVGSVATPFEVEPYETALRKCQRYYYKHAPSGQTYMAFYYASTSQPRLVLPLPVPMRTNVATTGVTHTGWAGGTTPNTLNGDTTMGAINFYSSGGGTFYADTGTVIQVNAEL